MLTPSETFGESLARPLTHPADNAEHCSSALLPHSPPILLLLLLLLLWMVVAVNH